MMTPRKSFALSWLLISFAMSGNLWAVEAASKLELYYFYIEFNQSTTPQATIAALPLITNHTIGFSPDAIEMGIVDGLPRVTAVSGTLVDVTTVATEAEDGKMHNVTLAESKKLSVFSLNPADTNYIKFALQEILWGMQSDYNRGCQPKAPDDPSSWDTNIHIGYPKDMNGDLQADQGLELFDPLDFTTQLISLDEAHTFFDWGVELKQEYSDNYASANGGEKMMPTRWDQGVHFVTSAVHYENAESTAGLTIEGHLSTYSRKRVFDGTQWKDFTPPQYDQGELKTATLAELKALFEEKYSFVKAQKVFNKMEGGMIQTSFSAYAPAPAIPLVPGLVNTVNFDGLTCK